MRRTGKTITMYEGMIPSLLKGIETFIVGEKVDIQQMKNYFHEFYGMNIVCEPVFTSHYFPQREMYTEYGLVQQITKYKPTIIGYKIFKTWKSIKTSYL